MRVLSLDARLALGKHQMDALNAPLHAESSRRLKAQEQQDAAIDQILSREIIAPVVSESVLAPTSSMTARALADARQYDADGVLAGLAPSGGSGRYDDDLSESDYEEEDAAEEDAAEGESPEKEALEDAEPDKAEAEEQKAPD